MASLLPPATTPDASLARRVFQTAGSRGLPPVGRRPSLPCRVLHRTDVEPLREVATGDVLPPRTARCVIISEGLSANKNFYPADVLRRAVSVLEGKRCRLDHPSSVEESARPEGSVRHQVGYFTQCRAERIDGKTAITGLLHFTENPAGIEGLALVKGALDHRQRAPESDEEYVGFSIDCEGLSHPEEMNGETVNFCDEIVTCRAIDLVSRPARGGKVLSLREGDSQLLQGRLARLRELERRAEAAQATGDPRTIAEFLQAFAAYVDEELAHAQRDAEQAAAAGPTVCEACGHELSHTDPYSLAAARDADGDENRESSSPTALGSLLRSGVSQRESARSARDVFRSAYNLCDDTPSPRESAVNVFLDGLDDPLLALNRAARHAGTAGARVARAFVDALDGVEERPSRRSAVDVFRDTGD